MRTRILLFGLLLFSGVLSAQVAIGIQIGTPPPPPPAYILQPAVPGPGYLWVEGYWYPVGHRYHWHPGYWTLPPYPGAYWAPARYAGGRYFGGYWAGPRGRFEHDHHWDHDRYRDGERFREHGHGRGHAYGHDR